MRWVKRARMRFCARTADQSGATIIFTAVVLLGLLAMAAFAIDFGRIWQERRELQLGATAAALAVGEDCARDLCVGGYNELSTAEAYADANATDGAASIFAIDLDLAAQEVEVVTATENTAGGDTLEMLFARIVGFDTITVGANAAVGWGTPLDAATIPLIISDCEWNSTKPGWPGASPGNLPDPESAPLSRPMVTITFLDPLVPEGCDAHPGHDDDGDGKLPGGFGWLEANSNCETFITEGNEVSNDPGVSPSNGCSASEVEDLLGEVVLIPYYSDFDGIAGKGSKGKYLVEAHGGFLVAGYNFGGQYREYDPALTSMVPCSAPVRCIAGWFVEFVSHGGGTGGFGGEDRGVIVIKLIG